MVVSLEEAVTVSVWFSLGGPAVIPLRLIVCRPPSSLMVRLPRALRVGGSLTGLTVKRNVLVPLPRSVSVTIIEITAVPLELAAGVMVAVRLAPLPPKTTLALGTRPGLDDTAESV